MNSHQSPPNSTILGSDLEDETSLSEIYADLHEFHCEDPVVVANMKALCDRSNAGMITYGITMADNPLPPIAWISHAIEEALDFANYLRRLQIDLNNNQGSISPNVQK